MARTQRVLRTMSLNTREPTRDANGYLLQGVDIVPVRPKPSKLPQVMKLLQEANLREEKERERADCWKRNYHRLNQYYSALQLKDLCSDCQREKDEAENGEHFTVCRNCSQKRRPSGPSRDDWKRKKRRRIIGRIVTRQRCDK